MVNHRNNPVQNMLRELNKRFPQVTHVFFNRDGTWLYTDDDFNAPAFNDLSPELEELLHGAADHAYLEKGFPCAYSLVD